MVASFTSTDCSQSFRARKDILKIGRKEAEPRISKNRRKNVELGVLLLQIHCVGGLSLCENFAGRKKQTISNFQHFL